jgi:2-phospho-L-lactate guanylyltransferase (CobY/MobA/RfbA family)
MSSIAGTPTLLVFTLGAPAERARRPLLPRRLAALEVGMRRACAEEALAAGRDAGLATAVCSPAPLGLDADRELPQRDGPFGARLEAAMAEAFAGGAAPLVVVGADTPGLAAAHVERALALLAARPDAVVVGPSPDGGLYLLAAAGPIPDLAAVRWCRAETLASLLAALRAAGRPVELLPPLADLDRPADLAGWLGRGEKDAGGETLAPWRSLLARTLAALARPPRPRRLDLPGFAAVPLFSGRAPPPLLPF